MIDVEKQTTYWQTGAVEDWQVAVELINLGRTRHGLFFAHLALEKMLKAHICRATADLAPRIHTLLRLAERTGLAYSEEQRVFLARFDRYTGRKSNECIRPSCPAPMRTGRVPASTCEIA